MLCCEVLKEAPMIVLTTLPDHLHFTVFTCLRQELQQNRSYKALKVLNCGKDIFMKKPIWLPVASVCLGWHSRG